MNIVHFISAPASGGAEIYVKDLSVEMQKRGCSVLIIFLARASELGRCTEFERLYLKSLDDAGVKFCFLGNKYRRKLISGNFIVRNICKEFKADVLHNHFYYGFFLSWMVNVDSNIYTHHNIALGAPKLLYKVMDLKADGYIGICDACSKLLKGLTVKPIKTVYNAVDSSRLLSGVVKRNVDNKPIRILMVGRLVEQKNYPLAFDIFNDIKHLDFEVNIAGEGPLKSELLELLKNKGLLSKVNFLGNVNNMGEVYCHSDVFLMTSSWEGLPIALIEASLCGLPTLSTNVGGCNEVTQSLDNGFCIDLEDTISLSEKLTKLVTNKALRQKLSLNARQNSSRFSIQEACSEHLSIYRKN